MNDMGSNKMFIVCLTSLDDQDKLYNRITSRIKWLILKKKRKEDERWKQELRYYG